MKDPVYKTRNTGNICTYMYIVCYMNIYLCMHKCVVFHINFLHYNSKFVHKAFQSTGFCKISTQTYACTCTVAVTLIEALYMYITCTTAV